MQVKKPKIIETVGAFYYAMNEVEYDKTKYATVVKSPIIKKVGVEPEGDNTPVYSSGEVYDTVNSTSALNIEVETIAFDPSDLAKMKGETISENGLILGGSSDERPYFACGWPVKKRGGASEMKWYPKCKLVENTEEANTGESSFSEQTSTQNIVAYDFDGTGHKVAKIDTEIANTISITEEKFFNQVITSDAELSAAASGETPTV